MSHLVLTRNFLEMSNDLYLQLLGTTFDTKMAPNFRNVFRRILVERFLAIVSHRPTVWWRYIDDVFALWPWGVNLLQDFMNSLNSFHPHMKFTHEFSDSSINFLDMTLIYLIDQLQLTFTANLRIHINF